MKKRLIKKIGIMFYILIMFTLLVHALTFITNFNEGIYVNTEYNGSAVILIGENLTGDYTSNVFDAGENVTWENISHFSSTPGIGSLFAVDGGGDVYESTDNGVTWNLAKEDYGRTTDTSEMFSDSTYLYIISNSNREVWRSGDGETWTVINDTLADSGLLMGESDSSDNLYLVDASGDVYISSNSGESWTLQGDFNSGATNNAKGFGIDTSGNLYVVDGSKAVFYSSNSGQDWTQKTADHGAGGTSVDDLEADSSGNVYILDNKDIWRSEDSGATWNKINDSFTSYSNDGFRMLIDSNDNFFIADSVGRVFKSTDSGVSWEEKGDLNAGASNNPKGLTDFSQSTSLDFQVRSCDDDACSGESWQDISDTSPQDLSVSDNRYFQYKVYFERDNASSSLELYDVSINYSIMNTAPITTLESPINNYNFSVQEITFVCSAFDNEELSNITLYGSWSGGWHANETKSLTGTSNSTTFIKTISNGTYTWNCLVHDSGGLNDWANNFTFTISEGYTPGEGLFEDGALVGEFEKEDEFMIEYLTKKELTKQIIIISIILFVFVSLVILLIYLTFKLSK